MVEISPALAALPATDVPARAEAFRRLPQEIQITLAAEYALRLRANGLLIPSGGYYLCTGGLSIYAPVIDIPAEVDLCYSCVLGGMILAVAVLTGDRRLRRMDVSTIHGAHDYIDPFLGAQMSRAMETAFEPNNPTFRGEAQARRFGMQQRTEDLRFLAILRNLRANGRRFLPTVPAPTPSS